MEHTLTVPGSLTELKSILRVKFPSLTDADLQYEDDKKDEMLNNIRVTLGKTTEEWKAILTSI